MRPPSDSHQSRAAVKELLLEEYRNFSDSFWKNEQTGETRVNWFIGIVAAASGGLIGLVSADHRPHGETLRLIFVASLVALLVFGLITLLRIMKRNETTDGYKRDADRVRRIFKEYYDDDKLLRQYHPFGRQGDQDLTRKLGGLAHTVLAINSLLFAGLAAASVYPIGDATSLRPVYVASIVVFAAAAAGQFFWVRSAERNAKKRHTALTHAGGIVYRLNEGKVEYLLVGPKKDVPDQWLLPKGHIEGSEEHWETALREVREETGVVGRLISQVGTDEYEVGQTAGLFWDRLLRRMHRAFSKRPLAQPQPKERVAVKFYLVEYCSEVDCGEKRRRKWFALEQAMNLLNFPGSQRLLRMAEQKRLSLSRK